MTGQWHCHTIVKISSNYFPMNSDTNKGGKAHSLAALKYQYNICTVNIWHNQNCFFEFDSSVCKSYHFLWTKKPKPSGWDHVTPMSLLILWTSESRSQKAWQQFSMKWGSPYHRHLTISLWHELRFDSHKKNIGHFNSHTTMFLLSPLLPAASLPWLVSL